MTTPRRVPESRRRPTGTSPTTRPTSPPSSGALTASPLDQLRSRSTPSGIHLPGRNRPSNFHPPQPDRFGFRGRNEPTLQRITPSETPVGLIQVTFFMRTKLLVSAIAFA